MLFNKYLGFATSFPEHFPSLGVVVWFCFVLLHFELFLFFNFCLSCLALFRVVNKGSVWDQKSHHWDWDHRRSDQDQIPSCN